MPREYQDFMVESDLAYLTPREFTSHSSIKLHPSEAADLLTLSARYSPEVWEVLSSLPLLLRDECWSRVQLKLRSSYRVQYVEVVYGVMAVCGVLHVQICHLNAELEVWTWEHKVSEIYFQNTHHALTA